MSESKSKPTRGTNFFVSGLPEDLWATIFSHLPPFDLLSISLVNKSWNKLVNDEEVWIKCWLKQIHPLYVYIMAVEEYSIKNFSSACEMVKGGLKLRNGKLKAKFFDKGSYFSLHVSVPLSMWNLSGERFVRVNNIVKSSEFGMASCVMCLDSSELTFYYRSFITLPPGKFDIFWKISIDSEKFLWPKGERVESRISFVQLGIMDHTVLIPITKQSLKCFPEMSEIHVGSIKVDLETSQKPVMIVSQLQAPQGGLKNGVYFDSLVLRQTERMEFPTIEFLGCKIYSDKQHIRNYISEAIENICKAKRAMVFSGDRAEFILQYANCIREKTVTKRQLLSFITLLERTVRAMKRCNYSSLYAVLIGTVLNQEMVVVMHEMDALMLEIGMERLEPVKWQGFEKKLLETARREAEDMLENERLSLEELECFLELSKSDWSDFPHLTRSFKLMFDWVEEYADANNLRDRLV